MSKDSTDPKDTRVDQYTVEGILTAKCKEWEVTLDSLSKEIREYEDTVIYYEAEVIFTTCSSVQKGGLNNYYFHTVIGDEMGLATDDQVTAICMKRGSHVLICGDPCQLQPSCNKKANRYSHSCRVPMIFSPLTLSCFFLVSSSGTGGGAATSMVVPNCFAVSLFSSAESISTERFFAEQAFTLSRCLCGTDERV